ncbi:MAG: hypothetical protein IJ400_07180 [Clostridia bacterium]|nr:hypothetical protein [Clostridia bacterium]
MAEEKITGLTPKEAGKISAEMVQRMAEHYERENQGFAYEDFISALARGFFKKVYFSVKGYGHYKNCVVTYESVPVSEMTKYGKIITFTLAKGEECVYFGDFNEEEKLFHIKGKGDFTLKQMWKDIEIKEFEV